MTNKTTTAIFASCALAALFDNRAVAQDVILSEVAATGSWIELHNRSAVAADLSTWSLYLATATPGRAQTYWWAFRAGTVIPPGGHLLVRWLAPAPAAPIAGEVATGSSQFDFMFGLGAEPLPLACGGLALLRSQANADMNSPGIFADWVSWGCSGLQRQALAVQQGVWVTGHAAPAMIAGTSLARHPATVVGYPAQSWFIDTTPTPGAANTGAAATLALGTPCAPPGHRLLGAPALQVTSIPVLGNAAFGLRVTNTTGVLLEHCLIVLTTSAVPAGIQGLLPETPAGCLVHIDPSTWFADTLLHTTVTATTLPLSLANLPPALAGAQFAAQALVFEDLASAWPPYQGVTNGLRITLGQ